MASHGWSAGGAIADPPRRAVHRPAESPPEFAATAADGGAAPADAGDRFMRELTERPERFDFFQAVRRLECLHRDLPRVGCSGSPRQDFIRFTQEASFSFPVSAIASYRPGEADPAAGVPARMAVRFTGLLGPNGPMPLAFTDHVRRRRARGDRGLARFLDLFHHRMTALFYRAWARQQRAVGHDRPEMDRWRTYLGSLFGLAMPGFENRDCVDDVAKLHFAGRLSCPTRNAEGLAGILAGYFGVPVRIVPWIGRWIDLPPENQTRLGQSREAGTLGDGAVLGSTTWDCQQKFRIAMGPMTYASYRQLLPSQPSFARLCAWVRLYVGDELQWDARLIIRREEVPQLRLGQVGELGWSTWLWSTPHERDRDDLVLEQPAA